MNAPRSARTEKKGSVIVRLRLLDEDKKESIIYDRPLHAYIRRSYLAYNKISFHPTGQQYEKLPYSTPTTTANTPQRTEVKNICPTSQQKSKSTNEILQHLQF